VILFQSCFIAIITLVLNGPTTGLLVSVLGLSKETPTSKKLMYNFINRVTKKSIED
jgi:hypothetical protein